MFPVQFFVLVVQALALEAIFGGLCQVCVQRVGRRASQLFSLDGDFETSSPLKWFYTGCFFVVVFFFFGGGGLVLFFFSMSYTGVVILAPSMTRRAMFWTLSSLSLLVLAAVLRVVDAYSMVGRIVAV